MLKTIGAALTVALSAALALVPALGASATSNDLDPNDRFPQTAPGWYETAPAATYGSGAPKFVEGYDESKRLTYRVAQPTGGAPYGGTEGPYDIRLTIDSKDAQGELFLFSRGSQGLPTALGTALGTELREAYVINRTHADPRHLVGDEAGTIYAPAGIIVVVRPSAHCWMYPASRPYDAATSDWASSTVDVAFLGQNGHKYLAQLVVDWPPRPPANYVGCVTTTNGGGFSTGAVIALSVGGALLAAGVAVGVTLVLVRARRKRASQI